MTQRIPATGNGQQSRCIAADVAGLRTWAEVDAAAIRHNVAILTPPSSALLVMVKGNAYGHGAFEVARMLSELGVDWLGVSFVDEGLALRARTLATPILVTTEAAAGEERRAVEAELDLTVYSASAIERLAEVSARTGLKPRVHIKVNTGLNRVGVPPAAVASLTSHALSAGLKVRSIWTHFAVAEETANPATEVQLSLLLGAAAKVGVGAGRPWLHAANTAAILAHPHAHLDLVRAGIGAYGYLPDDQLPRADQFIPALSWRTRVTHVKRLAAGEGISYGFTGRTSQPTTVATVPVGFADGYPRNLSNRGHVLISGQRHPIIGTIAMDQMMVNCSDAPVAVGDEVTLIGAQDDQVISAEEIATLAGTIVDEILCSIHPRVPRHFVN
ncbi:alanine racemase [Mycobacterium sp. 852013-50091_SCH5140682]|uniref:alanine racemase n=1 Tax=Mycobacterium sp. 852013-50091_SCH5140682 TaxID=1834109 RepID=UPI0007E974E9|nr:alanine racemase [Mycobacterium sp. 852013-50091_SCH5140682]OBC10044.1 alanine racemase [Mycobacterium sp. 852013-50091_SCH5140682]